MIDKKKQYARQNAWNKERYARISVVVPKEKKDIIKNAADQVGESVNAYIVNAINNRLEQETGQDQNQEQKPGITYGKK